MFQWRHLAKSAVALTMAALLSITPVTTAQAAVNASNAMAVGVDVSKYQGLIDWSSVAASGVSFAFIKVGSTYSGLDPYFDYNMKAAQACGIKTGVYLYSYATTPEEVIAEAATVISWLSNYTVNFPVVFDIEDDVHKSLNPIQQQQLVSTFCSMMYAAGYYPMVYASKSWYLNRLGDVPYDKWVAQYNTVCDYPGAICFWQATDSGKLPGIAGNVDINYQYKDYSNLIISDGFVNTSGFVRFYRGYKLQTGWIDVMGLRYYADALGHIQYGWFTDATGSYYLAEDGHALVGPNNVGGVDFFFDATGAMQTGWVDAGGFRFFYDPATGGMVRGWLPTAGGNYYFDMVTGAMSVGAVRIGQSDYFFDGNGIMQTGWIEANGLSFYYDPATGAMVKGWVNDGTGTYYTDLVTGHKLVGLQNIGGKNFFFDANGLMQTGLVDAGGVKFFFDLTTGAMVQNGWANNGIGMSYFAEDGHMVTGITTIGKDMYFFDALGTAMVSQAFVTDGGTIYTDETGKIILIQ